MSGMQFPLNTSCIKKEEDDAGEQEDKWDSNKAKRIRVEHMEKTDNQLLQTEIEIGPIKIEENVYNNINMEGTELVPVEKTPEKVTEALKKTRVIQETKRWSDHEIKKMLSYIHSHKNFEKPTARLYYLKLLEETKINTKWHLASRKMRQLKAIILKANELLESTGAGVEEDVLTVQEKIKKICPHYDMLSDIFIDSREAEQIFDTDTNTDTNLSPFQLGSESDASIVTDDSTFKSEPPKLKQRRVQSSAAKPHLLEEQILALRREQLHHEREKQERNVRLEEKRLSLEGETLKLEKKRIELEQEQIQNDFILKKLQLEKEERIQKLEIELKYKYKNS